ncbi:hypothetical protein FF38_07083 [Lucilia cuprina]|uniref:DUF389 domain-containing protein n=1 Tax=Lucilia cuprina TaxID=7375 RepID=A0A0L0C5Y4_LUCCU|nr:hypothetical protein CVS40_9725 [Lucilia cuprina]KNC27657.1 hypothetical protein FF38_07083 [Lucilia cuprina]
MDGMASVLFVVTIPTAIEEERLKREFLAKKYDLLKSEQTDSTPTTAGNFPLKTTDSSRTTTTINSNITPTTTTTGQYHNKNEGQIINDNAETISTTTIGVPSISASADAGAIDEMSAGAQMGPIQYGTFPKRRKSSQKSNLEELADAMKSHQFATTRTSSLKDIDANSTDGLPDTRKSWEGIRDVLSSTKRKNLKKKDQYIDLELSKDICMETVLKEILKKFHIQSATWAKDAEGRMFQIFFTVEFNETYEKILDNLNEWGIGDREGSTVSVMNCLTSKTYSQKVDNDVENDFSTENNLEQKQSAWERFMNSVRSRLNVANIIRDVRQDASITFDFVVLVISAAILASFGLVEDSTIFLASSMLISPLMGPIIAAIFGTVIKDHSLRSLGLRNELYGILMAVLVGFLFGMVVCTTDDRYSIGDGLTDEMIARCELHSLIVGVFTAIPSGAAAAIGILGGNIGSLVGVAISASLLPPAVNSGLLWALALIYKFFEKDESRYSNVVKNTLYSNNQATELAILGTISMCLTISNIICIYIMGILVLKVKEIAPVISRNNREFWKHDIKIARVLNRNGFDTDTAIIDEFANLPKEDQKALGISCDFLRNLHMDEAVYQHTWSPVGGRHPFELTYDPIRDNYSTVHRIERLYSTITQQHSMKEKRHRFGLGRRPTGRLTDFGTSYKILSENIPRCSTMPTKVACPTINIINADTTITAGSLASDSKGTSATNTPTGMIDPSKRRKFIVTPAQEDPLQYTYVPSEDTDA